MVQPRDGSAVAEFAGALYHVIVRRNERKAVFRNDGDRSKYLDRLAHYGEKFGFRLLAGAR